MSSATYEVRAETVQGLVQGDHNEVQITYNIPEGATLALVKAPPAEPRPVALPVRALPPPFPDLLDRTLEAAEATSALQARVPVELYGPVGVGKTALLRHLCHQPAALAFPSGVVFREYRGEPVGDLLQQLFEEFYDTDEPLKPSETRLRRYLRDQEALIVLDDVGLRQQDLEKLRNALPRSTLLVASEQSRFWAEGTAVRLDGLPADVALEFLERRLGRRLEGAERSTAADLCAVLGGNPLHLVQAAALVRQHAVDIAELTDRLRAETPAAALGEELARSLSDPQRRLVDRLVNFDRVPVPVRHLAALSGVADSLADIGSLETRGVVRLGAGGARLSSNLTEALDVDRPRLAEEAVRYFADRVGAPGEALSLAEESPVMLRAVELAVGARRWPEAVRLIRGIEPALASSGQWEAWGTALRTGLEGAEALGDPSVEAWAHHQLGTRAAALEDYAGARSHLKRALEVRDSLGDTRGAAVTRANLDVLSVLERPRPGPRRRRLLRWLVGLAPLLVLAVIVAARVFAEGRLAVTLVNPDRLAPGALKEAVSVHGAGFADGARVLIGVGVRIENVTRQSTGRLNFTATVAPDARPGRRDVTVVNADGRTSTCRRCLTVVPLPPSIASVTPDTLSQGTSAVLRVVGANFARGAEVLAGGGIAVEEAAQSPDELDLRVTVAADASLGPRDVSVTNPGGGTATCPGCLTVTRGAPALPSITGLDPRRLEQGATARITAAGANFGPSPTVLVSGQGVAVGALLTTPSRLVFDVTVVPDAAPGVRDVTVTNPDGGTSTCPRCLTVVPRPPTLTSLSPDHLAQGPTGWPVTVVGTNFRGTPSVAFSGRGVTVESVKPKSSEGLDLTVTVAPDAAPGARDVTVTNPDGGTSTCRACFTVNAKPTVARLSPTSLGQGATARPVTVVGTDFADGVSLAVGGPGVRIDGITRRSSTELGFTVTVAPDAAPGPRDVTVTNPDGGTSTCRACFTVNAKPTVARLSPTRVGQGATARPVTVVGTDFADGVSLAVAGAGVRVDGIARQSSSRLGFTVTVASDAATGTRDVTVTNPDGGASTCVRCFTVTAKPTVTRLTPKYLDTGQERDVVVDGANFQRTPSLVFSGQGVTVKSITWNNSRRLTARISVANDAPLGSRDVTGVNSDGGTSTCSGCLSVSTVY